MLTDSFTYHADLLDLLPVIPDNSIVSRTVYKDDRVKAVLFGFAAGQSLSEHKAVQSAILQIVSGEATITLAGETREAKAGVWIHMPPNLPHSVYAKTALALLLLLVYPDEH